MTVPTMTVAAKDGESGFAAFPSCPYRHIGWLGLRLRRRRRWRRWLRMIIRDVWQWVLVPDFHRTTASKKSDEGRPEDQ